MLLLGLKEFIRRIYTNIFTALQLALVFIIILSIVSSVQSRTERYLPLKKHLDGAGNYGAIMTSVSDIANEKQLFEEYPEIDSVFCAYTPDIYFENSDCEYKLISYTDEIINMYTPRMKSGRWFNASELNSSKAINGVVSSGSGFNIGDTVKIHHVSYSESDTTFTNPIE